MSSFKQKNVLITGGGSGIGLLMAREVAEKGTKHVIIWDINPENLASARNQLKSTSAELTLQQVDVADSDQILQVASELLDTTGAVDILINNAGIIVGGAFSEMSPRQIRKTIDINLTGMMQVARAFLPAMMSRKSGHIVNIASAAGLTPNPSMSVYAASKWGTVGWSESLRIELEQEQTGIRVTTVEPGYIDTGMFAGVTPPRFTPLLDPENFSRRIIRAVAKNRIHLRAPFMAKLLPFLRGVLPARVFDFVVGKLFGVYHSMDTFAGRKQA